VVADNNSRREPINVVLPAEPPGLTPGAARALLKILVKAYEKQAAEADEVPAAAETPAVQAFGTGEAVFLLPPDTESRPSRSSLILR
jgi:hypothetical protein